MRAIFTAALTLSMIAAAPALAASLVVPVHHSARLPISGQAASVIVSNTAVADVQVVDSHTVFVLAKGYGDTDVIVLDRAGRTLYSGDIVVSSPSDQVSIYRGAQRTDVACAPACSSQEGGENPLATLFSAISSAAGKSVGSAATPVASATTAGLKTP